MVIEPDRSLATHLSLPVWNPVSGASMVTCVPGAQNSLGRHISCRLSSQPHDPSVLGLVVTETACSRTYGRKARRPGSGSPA